MGNNSRLSHVYHNMKKRCYNPSHSQFKHYGGRGITVCPEWLNRERAGIKNYTKGFIAFQEWALANGYTDNLTIDRIDNNKGYCPENCRWVTMKVQDNNKRSNHYITYKGQTKTLTEWCELLGLSYSKVKQRINKLKWSPEEALELVSKKPTHRL